ncbi:hypothetical protein L7F22_030424 [Adiantum nelumboides]|nr:hypothetical protein [Adiantum nelumboides]
MIKLYRPMALLHQEGNHKVTKGTKRQRAAAVIWDDANTHTLLRVYEETWLHLKKEKFRLKDWEDVTLALNREVQGSYNPEHARNRIDVLKKMYKELSKQNSSGAAPSTWPLFAQCDELWGTTPKASGIAGAFDSEKQGTFSAAGPSLECATDMDCEEGGSSSRILQAKPSASSADVELQGVYGKKAKTSKSTLGTFTKTMETQLQGMSEAITKTEKNKLSAYREIEMTRMEHDAKMQQNYLNMQCEIAKLFAKKQQD